MSMPHDPVASLGLEGFARALRQGTITSERAVHDYLERIDELDPLLGAFELVNGEQALATARAMDALLAAGVDLGPLMGLPISVKDLFVLDGKPPHAGSNLPLQDKFSSQEGSFITAIKEAGCVILGTTRMVEFALGITGHSISRGTPWNPWDDAHHRLPGGSSSGAGVALAAGLCALSIGSDTGGSVRVPAAMCGLFGLKTTAGLWPNDGAFPLEPNTDTIGLLTHTARDAKIAFHALNHRLNSDSCGHGSDIALSRITLGLPQEYLLEALDDDIQHAFEKAVSVLSTGAATITPVSIPNVDGRERYFPVAMPAQLLTWLGERTFTEHQDKIDPIIRARVAKGLSIKAHDYLSLVRARQQHIDEVRPVFDQVDCIISPTTQRPPCRLDDLNDPEAAMNAAMGMTRNTQPANYFDWCAVTLPMGLNRDGLPLGLQLNAPGFDEAKLLSMAIAIESRLEKTPKPKAFRGLSLR